jgi:hypothetical protein
MKTIRWTRICREKSHVSATKPKSQPELPLLKLAKEKDKIRRRKVNSLETPLIAKDKVEVYVIIAMRTFYDILIECSLLCSTKYKISNYDFSL